MEEQGTKRNWKSTTRGGHVRVWRRGSIVWETLTKPRHVLLFHIGMIKRRCLGGFRPAGASAFSYGDLNDMPRPWLYI